MIRFVLIAVITALQSKKHSYFAANRETRRLIRYLTKKMANVKFAVLLLIVHQSDEVEHGPKAIAPSTI